MRKRKIKSYLFAVVSVLLVVIMILIPTLLSGSKGKENAAVSIESGTAENATISTTLAGAGTLTPQEAVLATVPTGVEVTEYLVSDGDLVKKGDALALVDRLSVMNAISNVQETLDYLKEKIEDAANAEEESEISIDVKGRVKAVYVEDGDDVQEAMLAHGALARISLDGYMAVEFETETALATGDAVTMVLSDGTQKEGSIKNVLDGKVVALVTDDGTKLGDKVQIMAENGAVLGEGQLYIHSEWRAGAYSGTIDSVTIVENEEISAGETLFSLSEIDVDAEYKVLTAKHRQYEEIMAELFELYQDLTVYASVEGMVSGVEDGEIIATEAEVENYSMQFLANAPTGDDSVSYLNYIATVTAVENGKMTVNMQENPIEITDYKQLSGVDISNASMTKSTNCTVSSATAMFELYAMEWQKKEISSISVGDVLLFAFDPNGTTGEPVWLVRVSAQAENTRGSVQLPEGTTGEENMQLPEGTVEGNMHLPEGTVEGNMQLPEGTVEGNMQLPEGTVEGNMQLPEGTEGEENTQLPEGTAGEENTQLPENNKDGASDKTDKKPENDKDGESDKTDKKPENDKDGASDKLPEGTAGEENTQLPEGTEGNGNMQLPEGTEGNGNMQLPGKPSGNTSGMSYEDLYSMYIGEGSFSQGNMETGGMDTEVFQIYSLTTTSILSITPQEQVEISIAVDELDILSVSLQQEAKVTIDALPGQSFTGTVAEINTSGTNAGGNSKYTVMITMERTEKMLDGMNASVEITMETNENILTVPVEAIYEEGNSTYLYTSYNEEEELLENKIEITTGISDGEKVEILSGISEGDTFVYESYTGYTDIGKMF